MSNQTSGSVVKPYGKGGRNVVLPVKASKQIYENSMVAQVGGACVAATDSGETGGVIGVARHDALGGSADGKVRVELLTDQEFLIVNDATHPCSDSTPYGTILYAVTDTTVGTVNVSSALPVAGRFVGFDDDGMVRVFIGWLGCCSGTP